MPRGENSCEGRRVAGREHDEGRGEVADGQAPAVSGPLDGPEDAQHDPRHDRLHDDEQPGAAEEGAAGPLSPAVKAKNWATDCRFVISVTM